MSRNIARGQRVAPDKIARAKELRREMTAGERLLWERLRGNRLAGFHFRRQQIIDGYIADFYCAARGLVVEIDGKIHELQKDYDAERDANLHARGIRVLRIKEEAVLQNVEVVLLTILSALK